MQRGPQLQPAPTPLGIFPEFIGYQCESVVLKEKIGFAHNDNFSISTTSGRPVLQVQREFMSLSQRKRVLDMNGKHLFTIRGEISFGPKSYFCEGPNGQRFLEVRGKWSFGSPKSSIQFLNPNSGKTENLYMKGEFFNTGGEIIDQSTGQTVAIIDRKFSGRDFFGAQTYVLTVAPNVDLALMCALCICLDERIESRRN